MKDGRVRGTPWGGGGEVDEREEEVDTVPWRRHARQLLMSRPQCSHLSLLVAVWCRSAGSAAPRTKVKLQLKQSAPASTTAVPAAVPAAVTTSTDTQASREQQLRLSLRALGESLLPAASHC